MAPEEKPYRVYKGGRVKGKVPAPSGPSAVRPRRSARKDAAGGYRGPGPVRRGGGGRFAWLRRIQWRRWLPVAAGVLVAIVLLWGVV
jgi:hypothetical protein